MTFEKYIYKNYTTMKITDINGKVTLSNGVEMPYLGLGTWKSNEGPEVIEAVKWAIETGYRHIDTAAVYMNEKGVGEGIRQSGIVRSEVFVTSKVWNGDQGYESTLKACKKSLNKLGLDQLDLYLVHWPVKGKYKETWRAMEKIYKEGLARAIGVSNFMQHHLEDLLSDVEIVPMVNQMECHPRLVQQDLIDFCHARNIRYEAWSPIMKGGVNDIDLLKQIGKKYGKSPVQVTLRWNLQKGIVTIPKSTNRDRIRQNADIFDFELSNDEVTQFDGLHANYRIGPDPDNFDF
jgi:diketogulonate reductase-like aldo/keto reductase